MDKEINKIHIFWEATKFCKISIVDLSNVVMVKPTVEISQKFVAFSEYMNFTPTLNPLLLHFHSNATNATKYPKNIFKVYDEHYNTGFNPIVWGLGTAFPLGLKTVPEKYRISKDVKEDYFLYLLT